MQRVGKFSLGRGGGGSNWGLPWGLLCGTSGNRKLCMVPCHICHIYGSWRSRGGGCYVVIIWGWQCKPQEGGCNFNGEGGVGFSLYVILLCWNFVTGYCKRFYRIPPFPVFLLFHLLCIYWDWQGQKCKLECPKIYEINYIVTVISACTQKTRTKT